MAEETKTKTEESKETPRSFTEELTVAGGQVLDRVQELLSQGNIRRIIIKEQGGRTLLEVPLTLGVVGGAVAVLWAPIWAAIGAVAALVARVHIVVERYEDPADAEREKPAGGGVVEVKEKKE